MRNYEGMFIVRPDLNETERTNIFNQIKETLTKFQATIKNAAIWQEKRRLYFDIRSKSQAMKFKEGMYYVVDFSVGPQEIIKLKAALRLNDNVLRFLILNKEQ